MSPKYRHRGYMDSNDNERERSKPAARDSLTMEEKIQRKSMRKATDRQAHEILRCHSCGRNVPDHTAITINSECPNCRAALHCCRACRFFNTSARWQCDAEIKAAIGDKNRNNPCDKYEPRLVLDSTGRRSAPSGRASNDPKSLFDSLFKN